MLVYILIPLDFSYATASLAGKQFEEKVGVVSSILTSLGHEVCRMYVTKEQADFYKENKQKHLEMLSNILRDISNADKVFLVHRSSSDITPIWLVPLCDLLNNYGITVHESLDTLLGYVVDK